MSRKHNTRHQRSKSNYPDRLQARGLSKSPNMPTLESLRKRQTDKAKYYDTLAPDLDW